MADGDSDLVVVITGASSGIGRETALAFARRGATVVLTARHAAALNTAARACVAAGGRAMAIPADVGDGDAMKALVHRAIEAFGRIDMWINNAGVLALGRFEDLPPEVFERVVRTNLFGVVNGCRAVLPHFLDAGRGTIVNVASVEGVLGVRYSTPYVAAKFAVRGFSEALRQELVDEPGIRVCTVLPGSVDTELWGNAANYTGRIARPVRPVMSAGQVASTILALADRPRREVFPGPAGRWMALPHALFPGWTEKAMARIAERMMFEPRSTPQTPGAVFQPNPDHPTSGTRHVAPPERERPSRRFSWINLALFLLPIGVIGRLPVTADGLGGMRR